MEFLSIEPTSTIGTITAWAKTVGISQSAACQRVKVHKIPKLENGLIDFDVANEICAASMNPQMQEKVAKGRNGAGGLKNGAAAAPKPVSELGKVQIEREKLRHKREKLEFDEMEGKLVSIDEVRSYESAMFAQIRSAVLVIGSELRDDLAGIDDPVRIEALINTRVNQALTKLAEWRP